MKKKKKRIKKMVTLKEDNKLETLPGRIWMPGSKQLEQQSSTETTRSIDWFSTSPEHPYTHTYVRTQALTTL